MKQVPYQSPSCNTQVPASVHPLLKLSSTKRSEVFIIVTMRNAVFTQISILEYGCGISCTKHSHVYTVIIQFKCTMQDKVKLSFKQEVLQELNPTAHAPDQRKIHPLLKLLLHCSYLFMWIQQLFLKAETLDFVEILASLKGDNIVCADSCHWIICWITGRVKCQSSFSRRNLKAIHDYLTNWLHLTTKNTGVIIMYSLLTPWDRIHFSESNSSLASQEISCIVWNPRIYYYVHKSQSKSDENSPCALILFPADPL